MPASPSTAKFTMQATHPTFRFEADIPEWAGNLPVQLVQVVHTQGYGTWGPPKTYVIAESMTDATGHLVISGERNQFEPTMSTRFSDNQFLYIHYYLRSPGKQEQEVVAIGPLVLNPLHADITPGGEYETKVSIGWTIALAIICAPFIIASIGKLIYGDPENSPFIWLAALVFFIWVVWSPIYMNNRSKSTSGWISAIVDIDKEGKGILHLNPDKTQNISKLTIEIYGTIFTNITDNMKERKASPLLEEKVLVENKMLTSTSTLEVPFSLPENLIGCPLYTIRFLVNGEYVFSDATLTTKSVPAPPL